jgi:hypothetical protein
MRVMLLLNRTDATIEKVEVAVECRKKDGQQRPLGKHRDSGGDFMLRAE